jgi:putative membrane protein
MSYEIIKALHIISIIAWMAGLLYLPRLYVYQIVCVLAMAGCHGVFSKMRRQLENDEPPKPGRVYRIWNEVPTGLMIIIVVMAVVKPL